MIDTTNNTLTREELLTFRNLSTPSRIQDFVDNFEYDSDYACRSPRYVLQEGKAHCFEGAIFAAAALSQIGYTPLLLNLKAENDDDHVIAPFQMNNYWGAIAMSNFAVLRFREPVYQSIREVVMSYFDFYFNTLGEKSLREYSKPLNLCQFQDRHWITTDEDLEFIGDHLDKLEHIPILSPQMINSLSKTSKRLLDISLIGVRTDGLYKPKKY